MGFLLVRRAGNGGGFLIWQDMLLSDPVIRAITKKRRHLKEDAFVFSYLSGGSPAYSLAKSEKFSMI